MSPETPELIAPSDEILEILKTVDLPDNTQPTPISDALLNRGVAIDTVHEYDGSLRSIAPVQVGHVATIGHRTGHVHLNWRMRPVATSVTLIVPEMYHTLAAPDPKFPHRIENLEVRSLFYVLPQRRRQ